MTHYIKVWDFVKKVTWELFFAVWAESFSLYFIQIKLLVSNTGFVISNKILNAKKTRWTYANRKQCYGKLCAVMTINSMIFIKKSLKNCRFKRNLHYYRLLDTQVARHNYGTRYSGTFNLNTPEIIGLQLNGTSITVRPKTAIILEAV